METLRNRPLFTKVYDSPGQFRPVADAAYLYGVFEERSDHIVSWSSNSSVKAVRIIEDGRFSIKSEGASVEHIALRNVSALEAFYGRLNASTIYIDITGLSHHVWAPLIKVAVGIGIDLRVVYVEPASYQQNIAPRQGEIFDLSERIEGVAPLPLFTNIDDVIEDRLSFVPLLGFEGTRFAYLVEQVQPPGHRIFPIVGVPGFEIDYPFFAYMGNQPQLSDTKAWKNIRYARANCPFSLYYTLDDLIRSLPQDHVKVAPIGTKPHALGAVLLCATSSRGIELVYDHPKRKLKRTQGVVHLLEYFVSNFISAFGLKVSRYGS